MGGNFHYHETEYLSNGINQYLSLLLKHINPSLVNLYLVYYQNIILNVRMML